MKKFVLYLAVFLACVISVYPFTAGAWGFGDLDGTELTYDGTLPVEVLSSVNGNEKDYVFYDENQWSGHQTINFESASGAVTVYKNNNLSFIKGHGLGIVANFSILYDEPVIQYYKLTIAGAFGQYDEIKVALDGSYSVTNSFLGSCYEDDLEVVVNFDNYVSIAVSGTLSADVKTVSYILYFENGVAFSGQRTLNGTTAFIYTKEAAVPPSVDTVYLSTSSSEPYYPGTNVQLKADVSGTGIMPGSPESTVYWYVHGNTSADTYINNDGLLTIANDETATELGIEAISTYDSTKSGSLMLPVTYPLLGSMVAPFGTQTLVESSKRQELQFELILPNGEPFNYMDIEWTIQPSTGASSYFRIDDQGLFVVEPNAPAGASCTVHFAYGFNTSNVSAAGATVKIVSTQEGIYDNLTPTPDQNDKAEEMEDAIGDAADKLENNNSSLGQLTPTRPQINTNLEFDQEQMLAVSPLVTNIWSINGLGRMISIVLVVATVAYIFFGKRDG